MKLSGLIWALRLAVCSNGNKVKNINKITVVRKIEKRLRKLQKSVSRKYEMNKEGVRYAKTSNCIKIEKNMRRLHRRLANIRTNDIDQATNAIAKTKPCKVVMEDLNVKYESGGGLVAATGVGRLDRQGVFCLDWQD